MELGFVNKPGESVLSEKPRSSRIKKPYVDKWKDYDVQFDNAPKIRKRNQAPLIRDDTQLGDPSEIKRSKKPVCSNDEITQTEIPQEKPFVLNYDIAIPKRPRCISKQKKLSISTNILPYKKRKQEEFNVFEEGQNVNSSTNGSQNGILLTPKKQFDNEFTKRRRRFYEVCSSDIDPYWVVKQRIRVFWPLDKNWYFGTVKEYDPKTKSHYIKYDDHDEEWVHLKKERFKLLLYPSEVLTGENCESSELERKMENDPLNSCKSRKDDNKLPQNNCAEKKNVTFVYSRKRFHNEDKKEKKPEIILEFCVPIKGIFHFWINRLPLFSSHGKMVRVSQTIHMEMALIDNLLGLRVFNFEGHLREAVDIICFIISRFCPNKIIRTNIGAEMKKRMPSASIGIKISCSKRELYLFTYRFHELGSLRWGLVESYLGNKNCFKVKDLPIKNCTHFNARKISFAKDLLRSSFCSSPRKDLYQDVISQGRTNFNLDPEIVYFYESCTRWSLNPCLFLNTHLKFLMDKNTLAPPIYKKPNSILLMDKTESNSVSPTSVLSNYQNTPRSKKPRTLVSYTPHEETHNINLNSGSRNKTHYRKKHAWNQLDSNMEVAYKKVAPTKNIPIPGAHLMREPNESFTEMCFVREPMKYHRESGTEVERCMDSAHVVYDMDSDDEKWVRKFNNNNGLNSNKLGDDIFERVIDSFEKLAFAKKCDELSACELENLETKYRFGDFDFIRDAYQHWLEKRKKNYNLPLIRQFQPPLWQVYQKQVRNWELCNKRERPPLYAFCLKPRGLLESRNNNNNKGSSNHRSHKKFLTSGSHFYSPSSDLDSALTAFAKRSNETSFSPRTPKDGSRTGGVTLLGDGRRQQMKWSSPAGIDVEEFKSRDASNAAIHASNLARLKREKALLLFEKADLAMYRASCAILIADAAEKSQQDLTINNR